MEEQEITSEDVAKDTFPAPPTEHSLYKHSLRSRVRTYDVDRQNIVHNAVYLYWLEAARVEYFREIGLPIDSRTFVSKHRFVVAHTEIDYFNAAQFDDEYEVLTRVSSIKNSSFEFEQVIQLLNGKLIVKAKSVMVHLNPATHKPERINDSYREMIRESEGDDLQLIQ